jgi:uncharacterized protein YbbK (DUF523 family)
MVSAVEKILVSACLLGEKVKYHGGHALCADATLELWRTEGRLVMICPEVSAGFPTPRPPAEIVGGGDGNSVLNSASKIFENNGTDVTALYIRGAKNALALSLEHQIKMAILKEDSPSCGSKSIYDGTFAGGKKSGQGVTTALLEANGIRVFSEFSIEAALTFLTSMEAKA